MGCGATSWFPYKRTTKKLTGWGGRGNQLVSLQKNYKKLTGWGGRGNQLVSLQKIDTNFIINYFSIIYYKNITQ
jgi:hypothetical protein